LHDNLLAELQEAKLVALVAETASNAASGRRRSPVFFITVAVLVLYLALSIT
jgi:hypothetical protein